MTAVRPTERKAIAALLVEGAESPEELAGLVIEEMDIVRAGRVSYVVVAELTGPVYFSYGPYATKNQAAKAIEKGRLPMMHFGKHVISALYSQAHAEKSLT